MSSPRPVALITGASSGLGAEFARALAAKGAALILAARRGDRLNALAAELASRHGTYSEVLIVDLATDQGIETVEAKILATPTLHWLINNAGFNVKGYFHKAPVDTLDRMYRLQVLAPFRLTHAALAGMTERNAGAIINVASVVSFIMTVGSVSYASTKTWIHTFTEGIYIEQRNAGSKVRLQSLCPGYVLTEFHDVVGMDRSLIPKSLWLDAPFVVEESLQALEKNELLVIPGWKYRLIVWLVRRQPAAARYALAERMGKRMKRT
jgi:short-subunit dehydrogenase